MRKILDDQLGCRPGPFDRRHRVSGHCSRKQKTARYAFAWCSDSNPGVGCLGLKIEIPLPSRELSDEWTGNPSVSIKEGEIPCSDPATGFFIASVPASSAQDVADAVKRAKQAQRIYAKDTGFSKRAQILQSLYDYILENKDDLCRISARDTGKTSIIPCFSPCRVVSIFRTRCHVC